jgi:hypothetical protein
MQAVYPGVALFSAVKSLGLSTESRLGDFHGGPVALDDGIHLTHRSWQNGLNKSFGIL